MSSTEVKNSTGIKHVFQGGVTEMAMIKGREVNPNKRTLLKALRGGVLEASEPCTNRYLCAAPISAHKLAA